MADDLTPIEYRALVLMLDRAHPRTPREFAAAAKVERRYLAALEPAFAASAVVRYQGERANPTERERCEDAWIRDVGEGR